MSEPGSRRGRSHDAEGTREAILNAAEKIFAIHGFDGARIDAIAEMAGYNKSLIFHYYGDKLGLYVAVLKRIDLQGSVLSTDLIVPLLADENLTANANKFRTFLEMSVRLLFNFFIEYPNVLRILAWEAAEGWQTMKKVISQFATDDEELFNQLFSKARETGVIRSGMDADMIFNLLFTSCLSYLTFAPILEKNFNDISSLSSEEIMRARETIVAFVVHGIMPDSAYTQK